MSSTNTPIEWTDAVWNPIRGCSRVSEGCRNCYAEPAAARIISMDRGRKIPVGQGSYDGLLSNGGQWNGKIKTVPGALSIPLRWKKPRKIFVNSMSDLFHPKVPDAFIDQIFAVMALSDKHVFQILTKRPERMLQYCKDFTFKRMVESCRGEDGVSLIPRHTMQNLEHMFGLYGENTLGHYAQKRKDVWPLPNVWLGVSVEDQKTADERIPLLLETPAAVRWISAEPLLGSIDLERILWPNKGGHRVDVLRGGYWNTEGYIYGSKSAELGKPKGGFTNHSDLNCIDWVVLGGESGANARPMHPEWVRSIRDQCKAAGVAFLFKQWGAFIDATDSGSLRSSQQLVITPSGQVIGAGDSKFGTVEEDWREKSGAWMCKVGKKRAGRLIDGVMHDGYPVVGGAV